VLAVLLRDGRAAALLNAEVNDGRAPLHLAAQAEFDKPEVGSPDRDYRGALDLLMHHGADVHIRDRDGTTPLHKAAGRGQRDLAEALLTRGASVNARDTFGWAPLHVAAYEGRGSTVSLLVAHWADVNATTNRGESARSLARLRGHDDIVLLLEAYADRGTTSSSVGVAE
jgi:ankyrin repeat protein